MIPIGSRTATVVEGVSLALELPPLVRYPHIDRGSYSVADLHDLSVLAPLLVYLERDEPRRTFVRARLLVLDPGDYILAHHDPLATSDDVLELELALDLSAAPTPDAMLYYRRRGAVFLAVPSAPDTLAIVERGPAVTANHAYVRQRHAGSRVTRLLARTR